MKRTFAVAFLSLSLALFLAFSVSAETFEMVSDTLVYDPGADMIRAEGNVKITGQDMEAVSKRGEASVDGTFMRLSGDVDAFWEGGLRKIRCDEMESETKGDDRRILAKNVKRFEDAEMNVVLRADEVRGLLREGVFVTLEARGNVKADTTTSDGRPTTVTSKRADYNKPAGTLVFYGEAKAVQPGRTLTADRIIYRLESGRIEAEGNPRIVVEMESES